MEKKEFCETDGNIKYGGVRLIIESGKYRHLNSLPGIRKILKAAVGTCQRAILKISLHRFLPNRGIFHAVIIQKLRENQIKRCLNSLKIKAKYHKPGLHISSFYLPDYVKGF